MAPAVSPAEATTGRGVVPCNGQSDHGAVRQVDRTLHQSFAERTSAYDDTSVPVLHCAAHDFAGGSGVFVYQYDEAAVTELSVSFGEELAALCGPAFGVNNQFLLSEEFVGKVDGGVQISSAVALQIRAKRAKFNRRSARITIWRPQATSVTCRRV